MIPAQDLTAAALTLREKLARVGQEFHARGWSLATSSNYSAVLSREPFRLLISASGADKARMAPEDFVIVDEAGDLVAGQARPSAETLLHVEAALSGSDDIPSPGAVLHTHSVWATLLSAEHLAAGRIELTGLEMLKGLSGVRSHDERITLAVFPNTQDIPALARDVRRRRVQAPLSLRHGYLIAGHGLYTWGADIQEARRHLEALEFLVEVKARLARPGA